MKRAMTTTLAAALTLGLAAAAQAQDIVRLRSGAEVKCKVTAMTSGGVTYTETGKSPTTAKKEDVTSIELGEKPPSMAKADAALAANQYEKAMANYEAALAEIGAKKARDLHKQFVLFQWAQALALKGATTEAIDKYRQVRNEGGDCWLRSDSYQRSLELAKAKPDSYEAILKEMKAEPEPVGSQAELELAKIKYTAGDFDAARASFDKVASNSASPFAADAKLFGLRCVRSLKKTDELEAACKRILEEKTANPPALVQAAGAWMADLQLKKSEKDKTKWRDILMICVQAIALGPPASKEEGEDYALALLTGAKCYVLLGNANEKAEAKDEYKQRATAYLTEIKRGYSKTTVAPQAEKELVALGAAEAPKDAPKGPNK